MAPHIHRLGTREYRAASSHCPRGQMLLEEEEAEGPETAENYSVYLRRTDGSPPVRLGQGAARALSPDGKWVLVATMRSPAQLVLLPTGPDEPRQVTHDLIEHWGGCFVPDGKHILFNGIESNHGPRVYLQDIEANAGPRAFTPEGVSGPLRVSPDGKFVAINGAKETWVVPVAGGEPRVVTAIKPGEAVAGWASDGLTLYVVGASELPWKLFRVTIDTEKRELVKQIAPLDTAGVKSVGTVVITPDARAYAYSFPRVLLEMYVVEGLK